MSPRRFFSIAAVFGLAACAWMILGTTIEHRTGESEEELAREVDALWGPSSLVQRAPFVRAGRSSEPPASSDIDVRFRHDHRSKGLLWFSTYTVQFESRWRVASPGPDAIFVFPFSPEVHFYEGLEIRIDGLVVEPLESGIDELHLEIPEARECEVSISYATRGRDRWFYEPCGDLSGERAQVLRHLRMTARTDFDDIDYPKGAVSPVRPAESPPEGGRLAHWEFDRVRLRGQIGIEMPRRANAGPIAARSCYFAPISLLYFFSALFAVVVLRRIPLHPMHYLFVAAGFFAFHILLAYLVDVIEFMTAFWIAGAASVVLVVSYMRIVAGVKIGVFFVGAAQLVFLVGFSYAFLWQGRTGLTIAVGAVATLFVLMQATARVDWESVFRWGSPR